MLPGNNEILNTHVSIAKLVSFTFIAVAFIQDS